MKTSKNALVAGLAIAAFILYFNSNSRQYITEEIAPKGYTEVSSVLWKAHIYPAEIEFLADKNVIHEITFGYGDQHIRSVSYRNLHGYFDPVFITVWKRGNEHNALIVDPSRQKNLLNIKSASEIDISVSDSNKILLTYEVENPDGSGQMVDEVVSWPN